VRVTLRDGTNIRVDVFRPAHQGSAIKIPAIVVWSVYGKSGVGFPNLEWLPFRACVPESRLSGYEKFEGPDPAFFCSKGYAVINADARGTWDSEGDMVWSNSQEGRDGADLVDWAGQQEWCNGKVGMAGNSWLARAVSRGTSRRSSRSISLRLPPGKGFLTSIARA
jgi:putative CocE/NonD family hydrolase